MPNLQPDDDEETTVQDTGPKQTFSLPTDHDDGAAAADRQNQYQASLAALKQISDKPINDYTMQPDYWNLAGSNTLGATTPKDKTIAYSSELSGPTLKTIMLHEMLHASGQDHIYKNPMDVMKPKFGGQDEQEMQSFLKTQGRSPDELRDQQVAFTTAHGHDPRTRRDLFSQHTDTDPLERGLDGLLIRLEQSGKYQRSPDVDADPTEKDPNAAPFSPEQLSNLMNYVYSDKKKP